MKITHSKTPTPLLADVPPGEVITYFHKQFLVLDTASSPTTPSPRCEGNAVNLQTGQIVFIDPMTTVITHPDAELIID